MIDLQNILFESDRQLHSVVSANSKKLAKMTVAIISTLSNSNFEDLRSSISIRITSRKKKNLLCLAMLSYAIEDENLSFYLREELLKLPNVPEFAMIKFIVQRKAHLELFLEELAREKGTSFLFGNMLNKHELANSLSTIKIIRSKRAPKPKEQRRIGVGYRDKGHLPSIHSWLPSTDVSLTDKQIKIEENRQAALDLQDLITGLLI